MVSDEKILEMFTSINNKLSEIEGLKESIKRIDQKIDAIDKIIDRHNSEIENLNKDWVKYDEIQKYAQEKSMRSVKWYTAIVSTMVAIFTVINLLIKIF